MFYHKNDQVLYQNKTFTIEEVAGLYSYGGVSILLVSGEEKIRMAYVHEFLPKVENGEIKELFDTSARGLVVQPSQKKRAA